jgi:oxaloacetate decarboxylase gamma subunit
MYTSFFFVFLSLKWLQFRTFFIFLCVLLHGKYILISFKYIAMDNFELGLLLMVVGMTSVFAILLLVIGLGKSLIFLVNKYAPEEAVVHKAVRNMSASMGDNTLPGQATAAIVAAVSTLTGGNGKVTKIEKQ